MRTDANQIAFAVVRAILDAAKPLTLDIAGTRVTVAVKRDPAVPWPERGLPGVEPQTSFLAAVRAECSWPGGKVTLLVDCMQSRSRGYEGDVCLRVARGSRWLVMSDVKVALDDAADGQTVLVVARSPLIKRGAGVTVQPELNRALSQLLSTTALPIPSRGKVEIARVRLPTGTVETGADTAFLRLVLLALCKLDLADREGASARGVPLIDVGQLGLSPAALAALESSDTEEENGDETDDTALSRLRRRAARLFPDPTERQAALELMAYAVENAHDEKPKQDRAGCDPRRLTNDFERIIVMRSWHELNQGRQSTDRVVAACS